MSASLNKVMIIGNLTRDPETRVTPKGTPICQFSLAVNRKFKTEGGGEQEEVTYIDFEAWSKQAETIQKYCTKGRPLFVEGRLKLDQWDDKATGQKRSRLKVVVENFQFLGSGKGEGAEGGAHEGRSAAPAARPRPATVPASDGGDNLDDNIPF